MIKKLAQTSEQIPVQVYLVRGQSKVPWQWDTHKRISVSPQLRRKRGSGNPTNQESIRISLDALPNTIWNLNLRLKSHPVTPNTIVEWVSENGERTLTRGISTENCWYVLKKFFFYFMIIIHAELSEYKVHWCR